MTENEWKECSDPQKMLEFLKGKVSDRKVRLFEVACCRRIWESLPDDACREAVLLAERYADGNATDRERRAVRNRITSYKQEGNLCAINARGAAYNTNEKTAGKRFYFCSAAVAAAHAVGDVANKGARGDPTGVYRETLRSEERLQADLIRCIFGNPFRPVTLDPAWLTPTVKCLAQAIYDERAFDRLPILADALEDAGCASQDILNHCRQPGVHTKGCWPLDLILGKE